MHELSVAQNIVELAEGHVKTHDALRVSMIELEIGRLAGIDYDAFNFAWPEASRHTVLEGADLVILKTDGKATCNHCGESYDIVDYFDPCPRCSDTDTSIIGGKELLIKKLELVTKQS